jgi:hypothetical protein
MSRSFKRKIRMKPLSLKPSGRLPDMQRASQARLRYPHRATALWFRIFLEEVRRSDLAAIFAKTHNWGKSRQGRREMIQLLLMILGAIVAAIVGIYAGVTSSHHHEH